MTEPMPRLVCFPHAGGSALTYHPWRSALAGRYEVTVVDSPGRVGRPADPPARTVAELLTSATTRAEPLARAPYVLYGHSLGALVAFEVARRLAGSATPPELLVVSGRNGPAMPSAKGELHNLPDGELIRAVDRLDRSMPALSGNPELAALFLPVIRNDLRLAETYVFSDGPPLACPILSIQGSDDPVVTEDGVANWAAQTTGRCTLEWLPGEHLFHLTGAGFASRLPELISAATLSSRA